MSDGIVDKDFGNLQNLFCFGYQRTRITEKNLNQAILSDADDPGRQRTPLISQNKSSSDIVV